MPDLNECIRRHDAAQATRPAWRPVRIIRAVVLDGDGWEFVSAKSWRTGLSELVAGPRGRDCERRRCLALAAMSRDWRVPVGRVVGGTMRRCLECGDVYWSVRAVQSDACPSCGSSTVADALLESAR